MKTPSFADYEEWCSLVKEWESEIKQVRMTRNHVGGGFARSAHREGTGPTQEDLDALELAEAKLAVIKDRMQELLMRTFRR